MRAEAIHKLLAKMYSKWPSQGFAKRAFSLSTLVFSRSSNSTSYDPDDRGDCERRLQGCFRAVDPDNTESADICERGEKCEKTNSQSGSDRRENEDESEGVLVRCDSLDLEACWQLANVSDVCTDPVDDFCRPFSFDKVRELTS